MTWHRPGLTQLPDGVPHAWHMVCCQPLVWSDDLPLRLQMLCKTDAMVEYGHEEAILIIKEDAILHHDARVRLFSD